MVLHCKSPGKTQTIQDKRRTLLKQLAELKTTFRRIGIKTDFLTVLGFLPQDTETEKMNHHLVRNNFLLFSFAFPCFI